MKTSIFLVILCGIVLNSSCYVLKKKSLPPVPPPELTEEEERIIHYNESCVYQEKFSTKARRRAFGYRHADSVFLISFDKNEVQGEGLFDSPHHEIPVYNKRLDRDKADEVIYLPQAAVDSLSDIFYNWRMRGEPGIMVFMQCYIPRNAILFVDKRGIVQHYIEICFRCEHMRTTHKKIKTVSECRQHWSMIKQFFVDHGIKIGTVFWRDQETFEPEPEEEVNEEESFDENDDEQ